MARKSVAELGKATRFSGERAVAAAKKSREKYKQNKSIAQLTTLMLQQTLSGAQKESIQKQFGDLMGEDATMQAAMIAGQMNSAMKGNTAAFNSLMAIQDKEIEKAEAKKRALEKGYHLDLDMIADIYHPIIRKIRNGEVSEVILKGGRGGGRSSAFGAIIHELLKNDSNIHAMAIRKVGNTMKDSIYAKLSWGMSKQGLDDDYEKTKSPMEMRMKATGQTIYFRGADKPEKIKSFAPDKGYCAILWVEEADQFSEAEIRNIRQSVLRGGERALLFMSFNPPKSADHWINKYVKVPKEGQAICHATYLDVPREWLGQPFIDEAEHMKAVNPEAYEHEYLGIANGRGGFVFTQLEIRTIEDEEIESFDHIFQGVDWGLAPDPYVFVRLHYDAMRETIYFIDEYVVRGARNVQTGQVIIDRGYTDYEVTCDSAEKKSVLDYRDMGIVAKPAKKGPGSVEYGMKWLAGRKIVIDPKRTPYVYEEFSNYEFEKDKEGNLITGYPDKNNHTIDATRYALEKYANKRDNKA